MKNLKGVLQLAVFIFVIGLLAACGAGEDTAADSSSDEKPTIKIGYLPITHAVPLFIEEQEEKYEGFNLELVKFGSWTELIDALNTGNIDGASMLVTLAMKSKEQGIDLKAVALGHRDGNVLVTNNDIDNAEDLKGKKFAIPHKFSSHNILLYHMLKQNGLEYEDVEAIELPPAEMPAALAEGRIAGYLVAEPFGAVSVAIDQGKVLYQDQEVWPGSIDCTLVLREEFIEEQNEIAQEFMDYYVEAGETAEHKDEHAYEMASEYLDVDQEVMDLSFKWIAYDDLRIHEDDYEQLTDSLVEMGLQDNPPSYEEFVDNSFIDKAK
ncbi:ABC transporter substrate-binding protein [Alteribacillus iranensis]|uniref:NitT/TauT family transport system substrate-binding protein n=1 Tax=Alteribacillus iranensis TaxID=930128 RepID=A0A1I2DQH0_9BACI|nr:ABC transporter substrate-binding protein [Alteribacillus iranensis]SFE82852.1 NitT/TauT family transport system substrate-binding protein [Alteribacillus iranensis]